MSKELSKQDTKELLTDLHKPKKTTNQVKDFFSVLYKIAKMLFGFAIVGTGVAVIAYGYFWSPEMWRIPVIFCGVCTFADGWVVLWKVAK